MGMTIDLAMNNLSGILTEATEDDNSVCYVTEDDAETLRVAIDTMKKYQKIEQIIRNYDTAWELHHKKSTIDKIRKVIEDGNYGE